MNYFKDAKVGDRVCDLIYNEGKINIVGDDAIGVIYPLSLTLDKQITYYTLNGKLKNESAGGQRLFYYEDRPNAKYHKLFTAVSKKYPNETRYETILRYIREAEGCPRKLNREDKITLKDLEELHKLCKRYEIRCPVCYTKPKVFWLSEDYTFYHCDNCNHKWWNEHKLTEAQQSLYDFHEEKKDRTIGLLNLIITGIIDYDDGEFFKRKVAVALREYANKLDNDEAGDDDPEVIECENGCKIKIIAGFKPE